METNTLPAKLFILQTRWIGDCEWTNGVYVAPTEDEAYAQALAAENQAEAEDAEQDERSPRVWSSIYELCRDSEGEFQMEGWFVSTSAPAA